MCVCVAEDKPGYFKPKLPADAAEPLHDAAPLKDERAGQVVNEQVVPPKQQDADDDRAREVGGAVHCLSLRDLCMLSSSYCIDVVHTFQHYSNELYLTA